MRAGLCFFFAAACAVFSARGDSVSTNAPHGDATIRGKFGESEIVISTSARFAGAIYSLKWNGREFIDSADHGRELQSALNLDNAAAPIADETFNPTEAGSRDDGAGGISSSHLLFFRAEKDALQTVTQMAFWLAPGEKSGANLARNQTVLSDHLLTKRVRIGYKNLPNVIRYDVTFALPVGEPHRQCVFEALTGYMPAEFGKFRKFNPTTRALEPLADVPGEIAEPVVFSTGDDRHAMGIFAPPQSTPRMAGPTFGRFRFDWAKVVKWNCVFRLRDETEIAPGDYSFRMFVILGDVKAVGESLRALHEEFAPH